MKSLAPLAAVALAVSLACSGTPLDTAQSDPDAAKGMPVGDQSCGDLTSGNDFSDRLVLLCAATASASFTSAPNGPGARGGADKDRNGLIGQLLRAETKCLTDGDALGAIGKLREYQSKVESLMREEKIDLTDGAGLVAGAESLITDLEGGVLLCPPAAS